MQRFFLIPAFCAMLIVAGQAYAQTEAPPPPTDAQPAPKPTPAPPAGAVQLDHVVAAIGTNVILQSDVFQEMRFSALEPLQVVAGENTPDRALRRLIDRTLILEQMKQQQLAVTTPDEQVAKAIEELRRQIPVCRQYQCETDQGWENFLRAHDLTPQMVEQRWSQRMAILRFIDLRFRAGIRVSSNQIAQYYQKTLLPALAKEHEPAPPLDAVSSRIQEILLQQQVSGLFQDWLSSLRDEGNIRIVDPAYSGDLDVQSQEGGQ